MHHCPGRNSVVARDHGQLQTVEGAEAYVGDQDVELVRAQMRAGLFKGRAGHDPSPGLLFYDMSYYVMLCYVMLCYVMLCYITLCYVMLCHVCYDMSYYVMLCYVMLCYVIS